MDYYELIYRFIVGGTILSGATWLANNSNTLLAGILITIPLELVSLFFVKDNKLKSYAKSILIMSIATVIPVLFFYMIKGRNILESPLDIVASFIIWLLVGFSLFYFLPKSYYN